jgi:hypothetical protein
MLRSLRRAALCLAAFLVPAILASCGGGGGVVGSGGTGRGHTGLAIGTVNGFGSVIVDGVAFDDSSAAVVSEVAPGVDAVTQTLLGERVSVDYDANGVASVVHIDVALSGLVAGSVTAGGFSMLGQTVTIDAGAGAGSTTQFGGGYTQASDISPGDAVDVSGIIVVQAGSYVVQATRIDKLAAPPAYLRVSGLVSGLSRASGVVSLALGNLAIDATQAAILPAGTALANGQAVTVLAPPATFLASGPGAPALQAAQIRISSVEGSGLEALVSGFVSGLDAPAGTFVLGGRTVAFAGVTVSPAGTAPADGQYVQVGGTIATDGSLTGSSVSVRAGAAADQAELRGDIVGLDAAAAAFTIRGAAVDASGASLSGCPTAGLSDGLYVQVDGSLGSSGVVAQTIQCQNEPSGGTVERDGVASAVDLAAMSFTLTRESGATLTVDWSNTTYFGGVTPATLAGKSVGVEGKLVGGILMASKVSLDD